MKKRLKTIEQLKEEFPNHHFDRVGDLHFPGATYCILRKMMPLFGTEVTIQTSKYNDKPFGYYDHYNIEESRGGFQKEWFHEFDFEDLLKEDDFVL